MLRVTYNPTKIIVQYIILTMFFPNGVKFSMTLFFLINAMRLIPFLTYQSTLNVAMCCFYKNIATNQSFCPCNRHVLRLRLFRCRHNFRI